MAKTKNRLYVVSWTTRKFDRSGTQRVRAANRSEAVSKLRKRVKGATHVSAVLYR